MDGAKATWKVTCAGPPAMTGGPADGDSRAEGQEVRGEGMDGATGRRGRAAGEITRGADTFSGVIKLTSTEASMTIKLDGSRLEECDVPGSAR